MQLMNRILRWGWRDYSVIRVLDLNTKKDNRITSKTKYFSPDISPDGKSVVAVNLTPSGKCYLDILDLHTGKILKQIPNPDSLVLYLSEIFYERISWLLQCEMKKDRCA